MNLFKCDGGYPVANPADAHPDLCGVATVVDKLPLLQSIDDGKTWDVVGHYEWNPRFESYNSLPSWLKNDNP